MAYLGNSPVLSQQEYRNIDNISGSFNGSTTSFALLVNGVAPVPAPQSSNQCLISVNGVVQKPDDTGATGFRISGGNIIFSSAPTGGQSFFGVILAGADYIYAGQNFPDGTVSAPSITFNQDLDTGFFRSGAGEIKYTANGTAVVTLSSNNLTAPSFIPTSSSAPTNGVYLPAANSVGISTNSSERLRINSSGFVGIGTTSPGNLLTISTNTDGTTSLLKLHADADGVNNGLAGIKLSGNAGDHAAYIYGGHSTSGNTFLSFYTDLYAGSHNPQEKMRLDANGRLLVGTSSARTKFYAGNTAFTPSFQVERAASTNDRGTSFVYNSNDSECPILILGKSRGTSGGSFTAVQNGDLIGRLSFQGADGTNLVEGATIDAFVNGAPGSNDLPTALKFSTTSDGGSSPGERMRITSSGLVAIGTTFAFDGNNATLAVGAGFPRTPIEVQQNSTSTHYAITFRNANGLVGDISTSGSATSFNTPSDYRLKENVNAVTDGIARLQQLKPSRFNFIADPDTTVDGFIAHEVQQVVPEAITGEKDAVDDEGNPIYQGIDQSKLVPLLAAALQEAIGEIESLKARVAALESA